MHSDSLVCDMNTIKYSLLSFTSEIKRYCEVKIEKNENAGTHRESSPGHLPGLSCQCNSNQMCLVWFLAAAALVYRVQSAAASLLIFFFSYHMFIITLAYNKAILPLCVEVENVSLVYAHKSPHQNCCWMNFVNGSKSQSVLLFPCLVANINTHKRREGLILGSDIFSRDYALP